MDLEAVESVRRLKYRYFRTLDLKLWEEFADTLTEDARAQYGTNALGEPLSFQGRQAITDFLRTTAGPSVSGKPCPRLTAPCSAASCDMTVKMVVPTFGNLVSIWAILSTCPTTTRMALPEVYGHAQPG